MLVVLILLSVSCTYDADGYDDHLLQPATNYNNGQRIAYLPTPWKTYVPFTWHIIDVENRMMVAEFMRALDYLNLYTKKLNPIQFSVKWDLVGTQYKAIYKYKFGDTCRIEWSSYPLEYHVSAPLCS